MNINHCKLVSYVTSLANRCLDSYEVQEVLKHVDNCIPPQTTAQVVDWHTLSELLKEMACGQKKIECIKLYRQLTGVGLKETKDEIEKYWKSTYPPD